MIYLLLSDSHLTGAHCSSKNGKQIITAFIKEKLSYPLSPYFGEEEELSQILFRALSGLQNSISFEENSIAVSVPDTFVHHDITEVDDALPLPDAWDYVQWKRAVQWGGRADAFLSFSRVYQEGKSVFHTIHCDSALINSVNLTLKSFAAFPVWMGAESTIMLDHPLRDGLPILFERTRGFDVFHRSDSGPAVGKMLARKGSLRLSYTKGDASLLEASLGLGSPKPRRKPAVYFSGRVTQAKRKTIDSLRVVRSNPFKSMSIENDESLNALDLHDQSILSGMMSNDIGATPQNFFLSTGIQDTPELHEPDPIEPVLKPKFMKKKKTLKKPDPVNRERIQRIFLTIAITLFFIGMYVLSVWLKVQQDNPFQIKVSGRTEILHKYVS